MRQDKPRSIPIKLKPTNNFKKKKRKKAWKRRVRDTRLSLHGAYKEGKNHRLSPKVQFMSAVIHFNPLIFIAMHFTSSDVVVNSRLCVISSQKKKRPPNGSQNTPKSEAYSRQKTPQNGSHFLAFCLAFLRFTHGDFQSNLLSHFDLDWPWMTLRRFSLTQVFKQHLLTG